MFKNNFSFLCFPVFDSETYMNTSINTLHDVDMHYCTSNSSPFILPKLLHPQPYKQQYVQLVSTRH